MSNKQYTLNMQEVNKCVYAEYVELNNGYKQQKVLAVQYHIGRRPNWRPDRVKLVKYPRYYTCDITTELANDLCKAYKQTGKYRVTFTYEQLSKFVKKNKIEELYNKKPFSRFAFRDINDPVLDWQNVHLGCHRQAAVALINDSEGIEVTGETSGDKKRIKKINDRSARVTIIKTLLLPTLQAIAEKYGLRVTSCVDNYYLMFKDTQAIKDCIFNYLESTVIKELNEAGIYPKRNNRFTYVRDDTDLYNFTEGEIKETNK